MDDPVWQLVNIRSLRDHVDAHTRSTGRGGTVQVRGVFHSKTKNYSFHGWVDVVGWGEVLIDLRKRPIIKIIDEDTGAIVEVINAGHFSARMVS